MRLGGTEVHLAPFAPEEERILLLPVEAQVLEVEEGLPGGAVLYRLPLPEPAPEGSEAWREVELEALLWEAGRLLEREAASEEEAKAWRRRQGPFGQPAGPPLGGERAGPGPGPGAGGL